MARMALPIAPDQRARVDEFRRKHRIGLVTLLFMDMVDSTRLKQRLGDQAAIPLIQRHHALAREILAGIPEGEEIETAGDSFFIVFARPSDAVTFSLRLQSRLRAWSAETTHPIYDRIGIHVGEVYVEQRAEKSKRLYGIQVDTCARVMSLGQPGQILMTRFTFDNARHVLRGTEVEAASPTGANGGGAELEWLTHGAYAFKGLDHPIEVCEVRFCTSAPAPPPASSEKARRYAPPGDELVLGWRPALDQAVPGTKWILEKQLGENALGELWLAQHATLKERRVFKFCFRANQVRSLKREVTLFRLMKERLGQHPNIVGIEDVFFDEPPFYLMMNYAEGLDLRAWCAAKGGADKVALADRLEIIAQISDALTAAHETGVVHRDVRPANILVSDTDRPGQRVAAKLANFGIGRVIVEEALAGITRMGFSQTMLSPEIAIPAGIHLYMAPELLSDKSATNRSDIYSLGVVLYQLAIGDLSCPVTVDWNKRVGDPLLKEDLEKCFAGDPENRFATARELAANLRSLDERRAARKQQEARAARRKTALILALGGAIIVLGGYLCWRFFG